ncbi:transcriptional regulator [Chryseobacterium sp. MMS23-Vi53]|uniref:transcriptional regulator n=1 Tax=Chryseobacterium sp. MMS23-Vi53 TaxID=3386644 RepID=UPI0039EA8ECD
MFRAVILYVIVLFSVICCHSENDDMYFYGLDKELTATDHNKEKIYSIYQRETKRYKNTHDLKYLLSSKYSEIFLFPDNKSKKISIIYELLRTNDDEYEYITTACNFYLALEFEETSPKLCLQFLNEAIKTEEKSVGEKIFLPHLYHAKGRWYYIHENYSLAKKYFEKALKVFKRGDTLYIASMYNNFGLCENAEGNIKEAIEQTFHGIKILQGKNNLTEDESFFLSLMKGNVGLYYLKLKKYKKAELFLSREIEFYETRKRYNINVVKNSEELLKVYQIAGETEKETRLINLLLKMFPLLKNTNDKIKACIVLQNYYSQKNDLKNLKSFSDELLKLNSIYNKERRKDMDNVSDILNGYIIKNINQKYDFKIETQRRNIAIFIFLAIIIVVIVIRIILKILEKNKKEKEILEIQNVILENSNVDLEKDIEIHKRKIKNLHLNLNLKIETEKAFLENLKKIKRSKNIDAEETVKDLFFKINNLLQIDEKNHDLVNESSEENKEFMRKLSERFPFLSVHELRLCVYFRLNLSSKEVSLLENITPGSVRVYKTKIKSKIGLDKEEELSVFLNSIK